MIFIPFNTPSLKNSRIMTSRGNFHSPTVRKYLQNIGVKSYSVSKKLVEDYKGRENLFKRAFSSVDLDSLRHRPLVLGFHPVRNSKRSFDLHNCIHVVLDLMVAHKYIEDDDADTVAVVPMQNSSGNYYSIDKEQPGIYLSVLNGKTIRY